MAGEGCQVDGGPLTDSISISCSNANQDAVPSRATAGIVRASEVSRVVSTSTAARILRPRSARSSVAIWGQCNGAAGLGHPVIVRAFVIARNPSSCGVFMAYLCRPAGGIGRVSIFPVVALAAPLQAVGGQLKNGFIGSPGQRCDRHRDCEPRATDSERAASSSHHAGGK